MRCQRVWLGRSSKRVETFDQPARDRLFYLLMMKVDRATWSLQRPLDRWALRRHRHTDECMRDFTSTADGSKHPHCIYFPPSCQFDLWLYDLSERNISNVQRVGD